MPIPKKIHYVWLGGNEKPQSFLRFLQTWKKFCPDYEIIEWNENNFDIQSSLYARQAYEQKKYAFVSDYIRVKVLYEEGGVYLDTDVELVRSLDDLLSEQFVISFENDAYVETAILLSEPKHPYVKTLLDYYDSIPFLLPNGKCDITPPAPMRFTYFLQRDYGMKLYNSFQELSDGNHSLTLLTRDCFAPKDYTTKKLEMTEQTYAIHHFDATWASKAMKTQDKLLLFVRRLFGRRAFAWFTRQYLKGFFRKMKKQVG